MLAWIIVELICHLSKRRMWFRWVKIDIHIQFSESFKKKGKHFSQNVNSDDCMFLSCHVRVSE